MKKGAEANAKNKHGQTSSDISAIGNVNEDIVQCFQGNGTSDETLVNENSQ